MRHFLLALVLTYIVAARASATEPREVAAFQRRLVDSDASTRIAAMEEFSEALSKEESTETKDNREVLAILAVALGDPEVAVRRRAAECSAMLAMANTAKYPRPTPPATDLNGIPSWKNALRAGLVDPDDHVRDSALSAYALAFPVAPEVQDTLADRYDGETAFSMVKGKIPYALLIDNAPTPKALALLNRLCDDPKECIQIAQMLRSFGKNPPSSLLPKFVRRMTVETDPNVRDTFFFAVVEYRQKAKPFLSELENVQSAEPVAVTQKNMAAAIQAVRDAK